MPVCLRSQPSCHASLKFAGYSNLLDGDIFKMSNLKLSQPGVTILKMTRRLSKVSQQMLHMFSVLLSLPLELL